MLTLKELFSEQEIHDRISALGKEISQVYKDEPLVIICVLKGAFLFFSDLVRNIQKESQLDLILCALPATETATNLPAPFPLPRILKSMLKEKTFLLLKTLLIPGLPWNFCSSSSLCVKQKA